LKELKIPFMDIYVGKSAGVETETCKEGPKYPEKHLY
jgi:hypothetical protein